MKVPSMSNQELRKAIAQTEEALHASMRDSQREVLMDHLKTLLKEEQRRAGEYVEWVWEQP